MFHLRSDNARQIALDIRVSAPTHKVTITGVGTNAAKTIRCMANLGYHLRAEIGAFEMVWSIEESPNVIGAHIHVYWHTGTTARRLTGQMFDRARDRAGLRGELSPIKRVPRGAGTGHFGYIMKSLAEPVLAQRYLQLNGSPDRRKLVHSTNGFWRDGPNGFPTTRKHLDQMSRARWRARSSSPI